MFDITKLILKIPNFLTNEECDELINEFKQRENESHLEQSANYETGEVEASNFKVVSLNPYTNNFNLIKEKTRIAVNSYLDYLDQPKYFFTKSLKLSLKYSHSYRIMKYETGARIHPHSDFDSGTFGSISFNLNENYEGGIFSFFNNNYPVNLKKGDALIFPADFFWVHEVTPVTKGVRYSLNSFICSYSNIPRIQGNRISKFLNEEYEINTPQEELLGPYN